MRGFAKDLLKGLVIASGSVLFAFVFIMLFGFMLAFTGFIYGAVLYAIAIMLNTAFAFDVPPFYVFWGAGAIIVLIKD